MPFCLLLSQIFYSSSYYSLQHRGIHQENKAKYLQCVVYMHVDSIYLIPLLHTQKRRRRIRRTFLGSACINHEMEEVRKMKNVWKSIIKMRKSIHFLIARRNILWGHSRGHLCNKCVYMMADNMEHKIWIDNDWIRGPYMHIQCSQQQHHFVIIYFSRNLN